MFLTDYLIASTRKGWGGGGGISNNAPVICFDWCVSSPSSGACTEGNKYIDC